MAQINLVIINIDKTYDHPTVVIFCSNRKKRTMFAVDYNQTFIWGRIIRFQNGFKRFVNSEYAYINISIRSPFAINPIDWQRLLICVFHWGSMDRRVFRHHWFTCDDCATWCSCYWWPIISSVQCVHCPMAIIEGHITMNVIYML